MTSSSAVRFAVVGADHFHLFALVRGLVEAGAVAAGHVPTGDLIDHYVEWQPVSQERSLDEILDDDSIRLVVTAGVPSERAAVALAALRAGKHVLSDKPGVTTRAQLDELRTELDGRPGRPWTVLFSERFENRAIAAAVELARAGAVGRVVHVMGCGPHQLGLTPRPEWFWDPDRTGGILVDIGSHQADQFLAVACGTDDGAALGAAVRTSSVGNVACAERPAMHDVGSMTLVANGAVGDHRVDYLTADGLGVWGDVRLQIVGTEGSLEARANIDVAGEPGGEHLIHVDADGARRVDVSAQRLDWARMLLADIDDDGEQLMSQAHVVAVCDLVLDAQASSVPWGAS